MRRLFFPILCAIAVIGLIFISTPSMAVHKGVGDLTCGNCHTMHSSQGGTNLDSMGGDNGGLLLLRKEVTGRAKIHVFCLMCHSSEGDNASIAYESAPDGPTTPPKVHLGPAGSGPWDGSGDFGTVGAGGDFATTLTYPDTLNSGTGWDDTVSGLGKGHSLGLGDSSFGGSAAATPPGNTDDGTAEGADIPYLTCTSCHDPHGTAVTTDNINKYRNLKAGSYMSSFGDLITPGSVKNVWTNMAAFGNLASSPYGGVANSVAEGTAPADGNFDNKWPVWQSSDTQNHYLADDDASDVKTTVRVGVSRFCAQCHGAWHEVTNAGGTNDNNVADANADDWARHPTQNRLVDDSVSSGGGIDIVRFGHYSDNAIIPVGRKLPAADKGGSTYYAADGDFRVFCLSCHFAHGGPNNDLLRWDYTSAVSEGSQIGNGIASNIGCQQCHNR